MLPMAEPEGPAPDGGSSEARITSANRTGKACLGRVLVAEDDYFVALMLEDALQTAGYTVLGPVATGEEALELAAAETPDLVLMDIRLAGAIDGVDAAIALAHSGVRSIFVTAHSDPETKRRGSAAAPHGWIEKPFSRTELVNAVAAALS